MGFLYGIPFLFTLCKTPYSYIVQDFQILNDKKDYIQGNLLFLEDKNNCFEYQILVNTPLQSPFLPQQNFFSPSVELIEFHFLWLRIYIKNIGDEVLTIHRDKITISNENQTFSPIAIKELINIYNYDFKDKPLFWYTIPKKPILYFAESSQWFKNFFIKPENHENRKIKIDYYIKYFENYNQISLKKEEETLFYLPYQFLYENDKIYTLRFNFNSCNVSFDFKYNNYLIKKYENKWKENEYLNILKKLENQNALWKEQFDKELEKHQYQKETIF